ncbi:MAG: aminoglycoside phosphotransferase family protein [Chloroflexia bacterium]
MISFIKNYLRNSLGIPGGDVDIIIVSGGVSVRSKLVCLCWTGGSAEPDFVVKFARYPKYNYRVEVEYEALRQLQTYWPHGSEYIPRPLGTTSIEGLQVTVETSTRGRMLRAYLREHAFDYHDELKKFEPFSVWLAELHSLSSKPVSSQELEMLIFEPLKAATDELALSNVEQAALGLLAEKAVELCEQLPLPVVFNHNDSGTTNIMVDEVGRFTGLIDWESGGYGLPCSDLIYFLGRYAYETRDLGREGQLRGYREMFFHPKGHEPGVFGSGVAQAWLADYCRRLGIEPDWIPVLFVLCWLMHARNERNHVLGLLSEGQVLMGKPGGITQARSEGEETQQGHFRSLLRIYLENLADFEAGAGLDQTSG